MQLMRYIHTVFCIASLGLLSCSDNKQKNHGPIVLGDSSTIVTESDPKLLEDLVADLQPTIPTAQQIDSAKKADSSKSVAKDTTTNSTADNSGKENSSYSKPLPAMNGIKAEFKEVAILIGGVDGKLSGKSDLSKANGAVYTISAGNFAGKVLRISTQGTITKVSQRYQSIVVLKSKMGNLTLDNLSTTTSWETMKGGNGTYPIAGLNEDDLETPKANNSSIKSAVQKAAQRRRVNSKKIREYVQEVSHVKAADQSPLSVTVRSVMWKIDGKDANGKNFSKQIRVDIPM